MAVGQAPAWDVSAQFVAGFFCRLRLLGPEGLFDLTFQSKPDSPSVPYVAERVPPQTLLSTLGCSLSFSPETISVRLSSPPAFSLDCCSDLAPILYGTFLCPPLLPLKDKEAFFFLALLGDFLVETSSPPHLEVFSKPLVFLVFLS